MAYAAVASLSQTIHLLLFYHHNSISPQFEYLIISLHKHTIFLQSFLEDASDKAKNWEETIREVADRAEEIIELLLSDSLLKLTVGSSKSKFGKGKYELHYSFEELERVTEEMESIANRVKGKRTIEAMGGTDKDSKEIISRLQGGSSSLQVIAIVGVGGIGKTTLARNVYNNPLVMDHFEVRAWSTISREFNRRGMLLSLLRSMNKLNAESISYSVDELKNSVREVLVDKRYLIVLDDIWSSKALDDLMFMLLGGNMCRIIITTRSLKLAATEANYVHNMRLLDEDRTWNLLRQKIFEGDPCPRQLESVGKMIARSCRGLPLSIDVVSGVLAADPTEPAWEDISEKLNTASEVDKKILSLSYTYLPHHLRACFLYLASFPEDHELHVSKLIKLWVAEGFLNGSEFKSFEETGEECVEDLVRRRLVSVSKRKSNGRIKTITVHDDILNMCLARAHMDNFILCVNSFNRSAMITKLRSLRRVSSTIYGDDFLKGLYGSTIRTIMLYLQSSNIRAICSIRNVRLLRILDLSNAYGYSYDLPEEVFELFHLRYLAFCCEFSISEAISNLENLQTLIICPRNSGGIFAKFVTLPEGIWKMPQLRHLIIFSFKLPSRKGATSALENLQTLSRVEDFICSRENLGMIPNLKKLALLCTLRDVAKDFELHNLIHLRNLEILKIEMDWCCVEQHKISCAFPPTLKKLNLCGLQLPWEDMKIVASLPNLEVLKLRKQACIGETWETSEGGFSELTYLLIEESSLENWIMEPSHFPRLKCLVLHCCRRMPEVPRDIGEIKTLEVIEVDRSSKTLLQSAKQMQQDRQSLGNDPIQIQLV